MMSNYAEREIQRFMGIFPALVPHKRKYNLAAK